MKHPISDITLRLIQYTLIHFLYPVNTKKVVFAAIDNGNIDITAFSHEINTPEYSGNRGYYFQSGEVIVVVEFEKEYISFNLNKFNEKSPNYSILHIILQGYNGEYQIFTMIYSTTSFKSYILDNISLNSISLITQIKEELTINQEVSQLINQIENERYLVRKKLDA